MRKEDLVKIRKIINKIRPPSTLLKLNSKERKELYKKNVKYRRNRLIRVKSLLGGQCSVCGYKKNWGALVMHHSNPKLKTFVVNTSTIENYKWNVIETEFKKCVLLCSNCHIELHHPQLNIPQDVGVRV